MAHADVSLVIGLVILVLSSCSAPSLAQNTTTTIAATTTTTHASTTTHAATTTQAATTTTTVEQTTVEQTTAEAETTVPTTTTSTSTTTSTTTTSTTTTTPKLSGVAYCDDCYTNSKQGTTFTAKGVAYCLTAKYQLFYCSDSAANFETVAVGAAPGILCHGDLKFSILTTNYWLNGTSLWQIKNATTFVEEPPLSYRHYLDRLRPNEGKGWFYCNTELGLEDYSFFFSDGTYYDLMVNSTGYLIHSTQAVSQYSFPYLPGFITNEIHGCQSPVCCWFQANYTLTGSDGKLTYPISEFLYNSTGKWYYWINGSYQLYTGSIGFGTYSSFGYYQASNCLYYFSDYTWTLSNGNRYQYINTSIYELNTTTNQPILDYPIYEPSYEITSGKDTDPLATGGYFEERAGGDGYFLVYVNLTGYYTPYVQNGVFRHRRLPPNCEYRGMHPRSYPTCQQTSDLYRIPQNIPCDPTQKPGICGDGYKCATMPPSLFGIQCSMGFCMPDYSTACPVTTTVAPTTSTTLQKYGASCTDDSECYTGYCSNDVCGCANCTKVLLGLDYDWDTASLYYKETCIPNNSTVGGLGDTCNQWADVKTKACAMGLMCGKCPEVWNSAYASAICISINITASASSNNESCPACGYRATCKTIAGISTCTCPLGYNLEANMIDCYGWNVTDQGSCSVTCGSGVRQITRSCDKAKKSTVVCEGNSTITMSCTAGGQCPLPAEVLQAAVLVEIQSKVITTKLFDDYIETPVKTKLVSALNEKCLSDSKTFEGQCCPGKAYSKSITVGDCVNSKAGVNFMSKFSDGKVFQFYLTAKGNSTSTCCKSASAKAGRRKRALDSGYFDQSVVVGIVSDPSVMQTVQTTSRKIDSNAGLPSVSVATTTTSTTPTYGANGLQFSLDATSNLIGGLQVWVIGVIAGGGGGLLLIGGGVAVIIVIIMKKKKAAKKKADELMMQAGDPSNGQLQPQPVMEMQQKSAVDNQQTATMFNNQGYGTNSSNPYGGGYNNNTNMAYNQQFQQPALQYDPNNPAHAAMLYNQQSGNNAANMVNATSGYGAAYPNNSVGTGAYPSYYGQYPQLAANAAIAPPIAAHGY